MEKLTMLKGVIETYQNDFDCGYEEEDKEDIRPVILNLIVGLTKYVNDFRYCSKQECSCSPETEIRQIMKEYGNKLDEMFFLRHGLCTVNMLKVSQELRSI